MNRIAFTATVSLIALASGCANTGSNGPAARSINYDEASAFERSLQAKSTPPTPNKSEDRLYIQPLNKKDPCKLPTSKQQLERRNFRAYWDGQCKDGYANGFGRDIAISDTHHLEEITVHNGSGENRDSPTVLYDFVNNRVTYYSPIGNEKQTAEKYKYNLLVENILSSENNFNIYYQLSFNTESSSLIIEYTPFKSVVVLLNSSENYAYKFSDNSAAPLANPSAVNFTAEIIDKQTQTAGGVAIVRYANGQVRHIKIAGSSKEDVLLPKEYTNHFNEKYFEVSNIKAAALSNIERAKQVEREYLYMACNGKYEISGLDKETSTKICTWRDQFKIPYKLALEKYTQEIESAKIAAVAAKQQQTAQQQIAIQKQQLQQQQAQQDLQQSVNAISQMGQQMQNAGQQMLQNTINQPTQQVTPWTPPGGNQVRCVNSGSVTNCRY